MYSIEALTRSQRELLASLYDSHPHLPNTQMRSHDKGVLIYQRGLSANARRTLSISYPTLYALLGEKSFGLVSDAYLADYPFTEGDWGVWGSHLSPWLEKYRPLRDFPYLKDAAAVDWACHWCERSADVTLDLASLQLLSTRSPYRIKLTPGAGVSVVTSNYPVVDIWYAHQTAGDEMKNALTQAKEKLDAQVGQTALIWRREWKARVCALNKTERIWINALLTGCSLGEALDRMRGTDFLLETWLPQALENRMIVGIQTYSGE